MNLQDLVHPTIIHPLKTPLSARPSTCTAEMGARAETGSQLYYGDSHKIACNFIHCPETAYCLHRLLRVPRPTAICVVVAAKR